MAYNYSFLRQNFRTILGLMLEYNHLILYNYHNRTFTKMALIILEGVKTLDDQKAFLLDSYIFPLFGQSPETIVSKL